MQMHSQAQCQDRTRRLVLPPLPLFDLSLRNINIPAADPNSNGIFVGDRSSQHIHSYVASRSNPVSRFVSTWVKPTDLCNSNNNNRHNIDHDIFQNLIFSVRNVTNCNSMDHGSVHAHSQSGYAPQMTSPTSVPSASCNSYSNPSLVNNLTNSTSTWNLSLIGGAFSGLPRTPGLRSGCNSSFQANLSQQQQQHSSTTLTIPPLPSIKPDNIMINSISLTANAAADAAHDLNGRTVNTYGQHVCQVCNKSFKRKCNLKIHSILHTPEALQCSHCLKKFARPSNLREHLKIHTDFRPFNCHYCNKTFRQKQTLIDHIRTHTGEKPFQCDFCDKAFAVKHNLQSHRRLHTGERPYVCGFCAQQFVSKSSLNGHVGRKHRQNSTM